MCMQENQVIKFKQTIKSIGYVVVAILFFGTFSFLMLSKQWIVSEGINGIIGNIILWVIALIPVFFTISTFICLLNIRIIELRTNEFRIVKPLLFLQKSIFIEDIKSIHQKDYKIKSSKKGQGITIYEGFRTVIVLENEREISVNSFETVEYNRFNREVKELISLHKECGSNIKEVSELDKWSGISLLIFAVIIISIIIWTFVIRSSS